MVNQSNKIVTEIFSLLISKGVNHLKLAYDGIELGNSELKGDKQKVRVNLLFYWE